MCMGSRDHRPHEAQHHPEMTPVIDVDDESFAHSAEERGKDARKTRAVKTVTTEVRDAKQKPPRGDGIVPLPKREGGSGKAAQGEPIVEKRQRHQR